MNVSIFDKHHFHTSNWSGGTTTEMYISPPGATYADRNFDFRISTAKVETEKSEFTSLPGVNRQLMVLDGEITLHHQNRYIKHLKQFEVDTFNGEWKTSSLGTCTDYNLMTTGSIQSELNGFRIDVDSNMNFTFEKLWKSICLYLLSGSVDVEIGQNMYQLRNDNLLVISEVNITSFSIKAKEESKFILAKIG